MHYYIYYFLLLQQKQGLVFRKCCVLSAWLNVKKNCNHVEELLRKSKIKKSKDYVVNIPHLLTCHCIHFIYLISRIIS